ncbi:MAG TPA: FGGY-family carbohydrate kinase [Acidimicrobiales bacterium]|nr:FGGY-family carbohydrate kinase [Acidimicrobiales bacterium]
MSSAEPAATGPGICLSVDLGTGGPKVGFARLDGELVWHDHQRVETRWSDGGGATQDAARWWQLVCDAVRRGLRSGAVDASQVVAVSCTGQWASTVPVDGSGEPVGDCVMWMDSRGGRYSRKVIGGPVAGYSPRPAIQWIRRSGGAPSVNGADPIGHMLYLQNEEPGVTAEAAFFLEPVDYLSMRFTGMAAASHASMTAAWLTDNRRLDRLDYDPVLVRLSGVDRAKLPPLVATGSVVGEVRRQVADELGLPAGVKVVTGTPDLHSAACGAGAVRDYDAHLAISTSAWIGAPVPFKKTDALRSIASVPGLRPGQYLIADNHEAGGLCLEWARDRLFPGASYEEVVAEAERSPAGAGKVIFTPWLTGERSPVDDRYARGGFHNVSVGTTRADLARAVLEGTAFNNRWLHEAVESFATRRLEPLRIIGGGAQSDTWCQIQADVMGRRLERVALPLHANLRGAAIFAGLSLGVVGSEQVKDLVRVERVFEPDPSRTAVYDELFAEFPRLYKAQRRMFSRLNGRR